MFAKYWFDDEVELREMREHEIDAFCKAVIFARHDFLYTDGFWVIRNQLMISFDDRVLLCDYERVRVFLVSADGRMELWWYIRVVFFTSLDDMVVG